MRRRKFIQYTKNIGGAALAGLSPLMAGAGTSRVTMEEVGQVPYGNSESTLPLCTVKQHNGRPLMFVNGTPCFPMAFISYYPKQFRYKEMRGAGIKFFSLSITLGDGFVGSYRKGKVKLDKKGIWDAPGKIDFETFEKSIREILDVAPDAYVFPRIYCDSPSWWDSFHPAETSRTFNGLPQRQSFSSVVWRTETAEVLREIVRHIRYASYSRHIIGIHVAAGLTEEWCYNEWLGPVDYSIAGQNSFKQWILEKYNHDETLVKSTFNTSSKDIAIPVPEKRDKSDYGDLLDPSKSRIVIDYNRFRCEELVESASFLCKAIKEESGGNMITGVFYGYVFARWADHFALSKMLKSPYIDFITQPNGQNRNTIIGDRDLAFFVPLGSIYKAGKLFYYEADTRTCLSKWISEIRPDVDPYHEYDSTNWLGPETLEKSEELLKTVFSRVICTGSVHWWFDLWGGWYDHERFHALFSEMQKTGNEAITLPCAQVSQILVIVDEKMILHYPSSYLNYPSKSRKPIWLREQIYQIERSGAPYDLFLLEDLTDLDLSKYKMVIFLNTIILNKGEKEIIRQKYMSGDRTIMWFYAPGLIDKTISVSNISSLTGMEIIADENPSEPGIVLDLPGIDNTYPGAEIAPFFYIKSGADHIHGRTKEDKTVLAVKTEKEYITVLCTAPPVPWKVIQYYAMKAGVHIYSDAGDVVFANQSYLSVSASKGGERIIKLPRKSGLRELLGKGTTYKPGKSHTIEFEAQSCRFFKLMEDS